MLRKICYTALGGLCLLAAACTKDTVQQRMSYFKPVYVNKEQVLASIKGGAPTMIEQPGKMALKWPYLYLNDVNLGVHVIDYSNFSSPVKKAFISIPGCVDIAIRGNIMYADCYTNLVAIDIANPLQATTTQVVRGVFPHRQYLNFSADTNQIIVKWQRVDTSITSNINDVRNNQNLGVWYSSSTLLSSSSPSMPTAVANGVNGSMARFALLGSRLYTVSTHNISTFNVQNAPQPFFLQSTPTGVWDIETIFPFSNYLFLGASTGMHIFDVTAPDAPRKTGTFTHARVCDPVVANDSMAYVTLRNGGECGGFINQVDAIDIANVYAPRRVASLPLTNPHGLVQDGRYLLVCDGRDGLRILDVNNPAILIPLSSVSGFTAYDVLAVNSHAIVSAKDGLYTINYSTPTQAQVISKISIQ